MARTLFYSWQSDHHASVNRSFIEDAIRKALAVRKKALEIESPDRERSADSKLTLDKDTLNVPGTPDITGEIFRKIDNCTIFLADISFVAQSDGGRHTPNPNVLIEYGYARARLGFERIILVMNTAFGECGEWSQNLPFDLRGVRRPISYHLSPSTAEKAKSDVKDELIKALANAINLVLENAPSIKLPQILFDAQEPASRASSCFNENDEVLDLRGDWLSDPHDPIKWKDGPQMFLRVIPSKHPNSYTSLQLTELMQQSGKIAPFDVPDALFIKGNKFGAVVASHVDLSAKTVRNVSQIFRNGEVWGIDGRSLDHKVVPRDFEERYCNKLQQYLQFILADLRLKPPLKIIVGMTGIRGYKIALPNPPADKQWGHPTGIVGDCVVDQLIDEVIVMDADSGNSKPLKNFFDKLWGEFQHERPLFLPDCIIPALRTFAS